MKELNKWRDILCSWTGRFNIVKISVLSNLVYRLNAISISISIKILAICEYWQTDSKVSMKDFPGGPEVGPGLGKTPHVMEHLSHLYHSYWTFTLKPTCCSHWALMLQTTGARVQSPRSASREATAMKKPLPCN